MGDGYGYTTVADLGGPWGAEAPLSKSPLEIFGNTKRKLLNSAVL